MAPTSTYTKEEIRELETCFDGTRRVIDTNIPRESCIRHTVVSGTGTILAVRMIYCNNGHVHDNTYLGCLNCTDKDVANKIVTIRSADVNPKKLTTMHSCTDMKMHTMCGFCTPREQMRDVNKGKQIRKVSAFPEKFVIRHRRHGQEDVAEDRRLPAPPQPPGEHGPSRDMVRLGSTEHRQASDTEQIFERIYGGSNPNANRDMFMKDVETLYTYLSRPSQKRKFSLLHMMIDTMMHDFTD
ncbi:hypothetical protein F5Y03DRAFT_400882 [Xylaria venustula]|nr:hypothetical protein F5Y03DRAFT_400882 [Xylaria venustula]